MQGPVGQIGQPGPPGPQGSTGLPGAKGQLVMTQCKLENYEHHSGNHFSPMFIFKVDMLIIHIVHIHIFHVSHRGI